MLHDFVCLYNVASGQNEHVYRTNEICTSAHTDYILVNVNLVEIELYVLGRLHKLLKRKEINCFRV